MNDTILNMRQKKILQILEDFGQISSTELHSKHGKALRASKITLIRDLNFLIGQKLVKSEGKARGTLYGLMHSSPSLHFVDISEYFSLPLTERGVKKSFNTKVFSKFDNLFNSQEKDFLNKNAVEFKKRMDLFEPTLFKREFERFVVEFSWKSSQIEGNTYDLLETETLIKMRVEARGHTKKEAVMILNHKEALYQVFKNKEHFKKLSIKRILQLHELLMKDLEVSTGMRNRQVRITGTSYIPPVGGSEISALFEKIVETINKVDFPPAKALIASVMIAYLQPFADGNKRTARVVANAILLAHGQFPLSYRSTDPTEYVKAMILFYEQNNLHHMKRIFMEQIKFGAGNYFIV